MPLDRQVRQVSQEVGQLGETRLFLMGALLLADEPTTALDATVQIQVLLLLRKLQQQLGMGVVFVTHDLGVAGEIADKVAVMYAGRVIELGSTQRLFAEPMHPYTRGLLAAVPSPERAELLTGIEGQQPRPGSRGSGCAFAPRCGYATDRCLEHEPEPVFIEGRTVRTSYSAFRVWRRIGGRWTAPSSYPARAS